MPQPGVGHRKFDDGRKVLLPASQVAGPRSCWDFTPCVEEKDQPSDLILRALEDLFWEGEDSTHSYGSLLGQYRSCCSRQCLQKSRLRATAVRWCGVLEEALSDMEDTSIQWASWHTSAAGFVASVDFVSWLGGEAAAPSPDPLPVFEGEFARIMLHAACYEDPGLVDFAGVLAQGRDLVYISCHGLLGSFARPYPLRSFRGLETTLKALRLFSDLVRGALHLWAGACPSVLVLPDVDCPAATAVVNAAPFCRRLRQAVILSNLSLDRYPDHCFTL